MDVKEMMAVGELAVDKDAECAQDQVHNRKEGNISDFASLMVEFARLAKSGKLSRRLQVAVGYDVQTFGEKEVGRWPRN